MVTCLIECLCQCTIAYIYIPGDHYSVQLGYPKTTTATTDFLQKLPEKSVIRQVKSDLLQNLSRDRLNAICSRSCHATQVMPELLQKSSGMTFLLCYKNHHCQAGYTLLTTEAIATRRVTYTWFAAKVTVTRQVTPGLLVTRQVNLVCCRSHCRQAGYTWFATDASYLLCYRSHCCNAVYLIWYSRYQAGQKQP